MASNLSIPRPALYLGLSGLLPFLAGTGLHLASTYSDGIDILTCYGTVILCFMSGVLWGFAARDPNQTNHLWAYAFSTVPALWAFFATITPGINLLVALLLGFVGLLALDWLFAHRGLAPPWWMRLRILLTLVVVVCLLIALLL
ncbi:MAG: DUF3429 domain-containing protein [Pseudoprimorskyibacter sp.]|nr:DUF3429 domain-containing protein [Pseudoprimorskyibacter sp.]